MLGHTEESAEKTQEVASAVTGGAPYSRTGNERVEADALVVGSLLARDYKGPGGRDMDPTKLISQSNTRVRRLTPIECERLQGMPDNHTHIPWRNKPAAECPDGPRYKAIGNSMAVPVMRWIGERIETVERILKKGNL